MFKEGYGMFRKFLTVVLCLVVISSMVSAFTVAPFIVSLSEPGDTLIFGKTPPRFLRECDESLTEPITRCVCVKKECKGGYMDYVCLDICKLGCEIAKRKYGSVAYWVCVAGCYAGCWVPKRCTCVDYDCVTIYPCNWGK